MTPNEYQKAVMRTATPTDTPLLLGAMGLNGEAGEVSEIIKKHTWHKDKPLNLHDLALELGDVCWYVAYLANVLDIDFETILQMNVNKLEDRYPNGIEV